MAHPRYRRLVAMVIYADDYVHPVAREFGEKVKRARLARGWTQRQLADLVRTTGTSVSLIERGKANPTLDLILKLAKALDGEAWRMLRPEPA